MRFHEYFTAQEMEILRQRANRLAENNTSTHRITQSALRVVIGHENYALPIGTLASVYEGASIVPIPCTPEHILGVTNMRGHVIPVLNLSHLLHVTDEAVGIYVIVASHEESMIGMVVASVGDIVNYADDEIMPLTGETQRWVKGVLMDGTILLDLQALLSDPILIVLDTSVS